MAVSSFARRDLLSIPSHSTHTMNVYKNVGVSWNKYYQQWLVTLTPPGELRMTIGRFNIDQEEEAARAYDGKKSLPFFLGFSPSIESQQERQARLG